MDISRLLSTNTSSPMSSIKSGEANQTCQDRSPATVTPQHVTCSPERQLSDLDEPLSSDVIPASVDLHVAGFLKSVLGTRKWRIFTSRLCERKDAGMAGGTRSNEAGGAGHQRNKAKEFSSRSFPDDEDGILHGGTSPCAIAFLVKVEVVKEVLRNYVPNPYHPLKVESHPYPPAPGGVVHVTRASVLALCQWSNTQFAYWSRRSEAVSVLACHDSGLRDLFHVLYQRLYQRDPPTNAFVMSSPATSASWSSTASSSGSPPPSHRVGPTRKLEHSKQLSAMETERRLRVARSYTGKGLDGAINDIKRRTGASQFLRGRQSSLDPFGAHLESGLASFDPNWPIVMPSVHGVHTHSRNSSDSLDFLSSSLNGGNMTDRSSLDNSPMIMNRTHSQNFDTNSRRYDTRSAMIPMRDREDSPFHTTPWDSEASGSPRSKASSAGSKRKRDYESSDDDDRYARYDPRDLPLGSMTHPFAPTYLSGPKRTKLELLDSRFSER